MLSRREYSRAISTWIDAKLNNESRQALTGLIKPAFLSHDTQTCSSSHYEATPSTARLALALFRNLHGLDPCISPKHGNVWYGP